MNSGSKKRRKEVSEEFLELVAERFRILGEPMRLRILHVLMDGELSVGGLVAATGATQANISRHLQTLARAGILDRRKAGLHVFYRIADDSVFDLCELVCGRIERDLKARVRALL